MSQKENGQLKEHYRAVWDTFISLEKLSDKQSQQFHAYMDLLIEWNKKMNLTAITDVPGIVAYHFQDSLRVADFVDVTASKGAADIGTGAGFPGIPIKIKYPTLPMILIEVNNKKITFLNEVIKQLGLKGIVVSNLDWRTFLRKTSYTVDMFFARASLQPKELMRMFKPSCHYKDAQLVYWVSQGWQADKKIEPFVKKKEVYTVEARERQLIFFGNK